MKNYGNRLLCLLLGAFSLHGAEALGTFQPGAQLPEHIKQALDERYDEKNTSLNSVLNIAGSNYYVKGNEINWMKGCRLQGAELLLSAIKKLPQRYGEKFFIPAQYSYTSKTFQRPLVIAPEVPNINRSTPITIHDARAIGCLACAAKWWDANLGNILKDTQGKLWLVDTQSTHRFEWAAIQRYRNLSIPHFEKIVRYVTNRFYHGWHRLQNFDFEYEQYDETRYPLMYRALPASIILEFTRSSLEKKRALGDSCDGDSIVSKEEAQVLGADLYDMLGEKSATLLLNYKFIDADNSVEELQALQGDISQLPPELQKEIHTKFLKS